MITPFLPERGFSVKRTERSSKEYFSRWLDNVAGSIVLLIVAISCVPPCRSIPYLKPGRVKAARMPITNEISM